MARPIKLGLEYYPQDTDIHSDRKIRRLLSKHGANGYLVYDYIKCLAYSENGYWVNFNEDFVFDVADFLHCGITTEFVTKVIQYCFELSLLHEGMYKKYKILTSNGIQRRFLKAKRDGVIAAKYSVIAEETPIIAEETPQNDAESAEIKEKEIKVNESKGITREQSEKFFKFQKWIIDHTPFISKMKNPFTITEYLQVTGDLPYSKNKDGTGNFLKIPADQVKIYLESIQNNIQYQKKYTQPYLCIKNWWLKDQRKQ
jgi:hypothetical protein